MGFFDRFTRTKTERVVIHDDDYRDRSSRTIMTGPGRTKYGNIRYSVAKESDYAQIRENGRGVYNDSLIARGIVNRLVDNVINSGLTLESTPAWKMIESTKDWTDEQKREWTDAVELKFKLYANSSEADYRGRMTFRQMQRLLYTLRTKEGEYFAVCRYMSDPKRMNPLTLQILNNDQVFQPYDSPTTAAIKARGAKVEDGVEYDATGKMTAIYVKEDLKDYSVSGKPIRIATYGPKSGRRFIIHDANYESADQTRGYSELAAFVYELDRLTEYDIGELESVVASSMFFAATETAVGGDNSKQRFAPAGGNKVDDQSGQVSGGVQKVDMGSKALYVNNLGQGQQMKFFNMTRPNPNYEAFVKSFITKISNALGMPYSVAMHVFQASYSAARAEILFFWNNVMRRRDDFQAGFLNPFFEAWLNEAVRVGTIKAPGFNKPFEHSAWLYCTWNGISRPVVDPVKEVNAVEKRQKLGHTTGEREAKAYNGSDFSENVARLKGENENLADANQALDPAQYEIPTEAQSDNAALDPDTEAM